MTRRICQKAWSEQLKDPGAAPSLAQGEISHSQPGGGRSGKLGCVLTGTGRLLYIRTAIKREVGGKEKPAGARRAFNGHIQGVRVTTYRYRASIAAGIGPVCRGFVRACYRLLSAWPSTCEPTLCWRGQVIRNSAPPDSPLCTDTRPPCHSAMRWTIDRPRP